MRKFVMAAVLTFTVLLPGLSQAAWELEGSLGKGGQVTSPRAWEQLNLMLTPGYALSILRLQLGIVANFADTSNSVTNLGLRPMIAIVPPILPIYGRVIFAVSNLTGRRGMPREYSYGAAGGLRFGLGPIGVFAEVGVLPARRASENALIIEGRVGAYIKF
jgi:hypothetical protein